MRQVILRDNGTQSMHKRKITLTRETMLLIFVRRKLRGLHPPLVSVSQQFREFLHHDLDGKPFNNRELSQLESIVTDIQIFTLGITKGN